MSTEANKALIQRWVDEVLNSRDVSEQSSAYQLVATNPAQGPCNEANAAQAAFVQLTVRVAR